MLVLLCVLALAAAAAPPAKTAPPAKPAPAVVAPAIVSTDPAMPDTLVARFWLTKAEKTGYKQTADYDETIRYCKQLEAGSNWVKYSTFGVSGQGRDLPLLIVSSDRAFTPEAARATGKPIVLVQNGIHSGEIEGKDACLALVRDLAVLRKRPALLDHAILLVIPIFSVDAHERRSPYNRINQNGPEQMGWRATPIGLNLNRDYTKLETPEMRALIGNVFTKWWPQILVDDHTTDGADYRYDVTYGINHGAGVPASLDRWLADAFEGRVVPRTEALGHVVAPYLEFRAGGDPTSGIVFGNSTPRFSHAYAPLQNRIGILVETHMLKPYGERVKATYDLLVALLEEVNARPAEVIKAVSDAEAATVARARAADAQRTVVLKTDTTSTRVPFEFKGYETRWDNSDIAGGRVPHFSKAPMDTTVSIQRETMATLTVRQPVGYLIPQEWTACRDRMDLHGIRYRRFAKPWTDSVEVQHVLEWSNDRLFEGHYPIQVKRVALERRLRAYRAGDVWVPLDQPGANVAVELFEAQSPDGLMAWNYFDTVFQKVEYAESYVMEPIARQMMTRDPALAKEFRDRVAADSAFAKDPRARMDFFYRRSNWADPLQDLHPVTRALHAPPESVLQPVKP
jgi:hypothetical protein